MADLGKYEGQGGVKFITTVDEPCIGQNFWLFDQYREDSWDAETGVSEEGDQVHLNHTQAQKALEILAEHYGYLLERKKVDEPDKRQEIPRR